MTTLWDESYPPAVLHPPTPPVATGATAGTPGTWTPAGSRAPGSLTDPALQGVVANPATPWTTGQSVILRDTTRTAWSGTTWVGGLAPLAEGAEG